MKLITAEILAREAPKKWAQAYRDSGYGPDKKEITKKLNALTPEQLTPETVNAIIGNDSWTSVNSCDECGNEKPGAVVEVGQEPDYESNTAYLCAECVQRAAKIFLPKSGHK